MGRPRVILTDKHPYHVTARSNNRDWFDVPMSYCFGIYINVFEECIQRFKIDIHAFVLMNNHFHLLVSTPNKNISDFLKYFMTQTSKGIGRKSQRINHIYGGRNHKSIITSPEYYAYCLKYLYRNPVKAGITDLVEDYRWSTTSKKISKLHGFLSDPKYGHDAFVPKKLKEQWQWFNEPQDADLEEGIEMGFRKSTFKIRGYQKSKKRLDIEWGLPTRCVPKR